MLEHLIESGDGPREVVVTLSRKATVEGFRDLAAELNRAVEAVHGGALILGDMSMLDVSGLTEGDLEDVSELFGERDWDRPAAAVAIVAPDDATFETATFHRAYLWRLDVPTQSVQDQVRGS